jgi:hypothetical protein
LNPLKDSQDHIKFSHTSGQIEVMLAYSGVLITDLKQRVEDGNWNHRQCLGDIFLTITTFLKMYSQYVKDYSPLISEIGQARKDSGFREILKVSMNVRSAL